MTRKRIWLAVSCVLAGLAAPPALAQKAQDTLRIAWRDAVPDVDPYHNTLRTGLILAHRPIANAGRLDRLALPYVRIIPPALALVPGLLFLPRPKTPWPLMAAYGLMTGTQFGLMYLAVNGHISPGLASLVVQAQVFITIGLAMHFARETVPGYQWVALALAVAGILVIVVHTDGTTTVGGLALVLVAALSWAGANIASKRAGNVNMLAFVVWSSGYAVPPLLILSLTFEGFDVIRTSLQTASAAIWGTIFWQAWGNTLFGYAAWGWLLARHPAATISPIALLVPVFGMGSAAWLIGESLPPWKLEAALLVMIGLALNVLWPRLRTRLAA